MINNFATDLSLTRFDTFYFDVDTEIGLSRVMSGNREVNRFGFRSKRDAPKSSCRLSSHREKANPERIVTIDASQTIDQVVSTTLSTLQSRFPEIFDGHF